MKTITPQEKSNKDMSSVFAAAHVAAIRSHLKAAGISPAAPKASQMVQQAQIAAHRQVFGAPGVDEGTATMAAKIEGGASVAKTKASYTRVGNRNFPKNPVGNAAAKAAGSQSESDAGDMSHYDPNMGMPKSQVSNSGYKAPSTPAYARTK